MTHVYFMAGLAASLAMVLALLALLVIALRSNWNHANKLKISFIMPLFLVLAIIYFSATQLIPRSFDLLQLAGRQYGVAEIDMQAVHLGRSSLIADGRAYYFMPGTFEADSQGRYQILFTPGMRFVIHVTTLGDALDK